MNPEEIYTAITYNKAILSKGAVVVKMICSFFVPCHKGFLCNRFPKSKMLDFDLIEKTWHMLTGKPSSSSTDGLTYTSKHLCFIEAKGWKKFLEYQPELQKESTTEPEESRIYQRIKKQNRKYHFQKKLLESISICEEIIGENVIVGRIPVLYILVTDVNPLQDSASLIFQQLNYLANSSSKWETLCVGEMRKRFEEEIGETRGIEARFIQCKQLDSYLFNPA